MNLSNVLKFVDLTLHQKCRYLELFWSLFSRIWTEYGEIRLRIHSECGKIQTRVTPKVLQSSQENTCATNFLFLKKKLQVALVAASGINFYIKVRASVESSTPGNLLFCDNSPFFANFFILVHGNSKFLLEISNFRNPKPSKFNVRNQN